MGKGLRSYQYASPFDGFLVDLAIGPAEVLNKAMFDGNPVFTDKGGATISSNVLAAETHGCLVWLRSFDGSPDAVAMLFHELVHASVLRYRKSGILLRDPTRKTVSSGMVSFDELVAYSVNELGAAFLKMLSYRRKR